MSLGRVGGVAKEEPALTPGSREQRAGGGAADPLTGEPSLQTALGYSAALGALSK